MTAGAGSAALPPSVYVSRLRRAFFLRVHPDRFRSHNTAVRQQQARLVQALNDRLSWSDFLSYNYDGSSNSHRDAMPPPGSQQVMAKNLPFSLEHRNGSFLQKTIHLDDSVENILNSMSQALLDSGAAPPPPPPKVNHSTNNAANNGNGDRQNPYDGTIAWTQEDRRSARSKQQQQQQQQQNPYTNIDHRFDINTTKGRDLLAFCQSLERQQIEERRQFRMDANASAMMGRRMYQFQSIDGTSLHWSSKSFAILMNSLMDLHEEHKTKFHVDSFYPLRLVFSNHDFDVEEEALDLFGGIIHLHPGKTVIQWLQVLQLVNTKRLNDLQRNRKLLEQAQLKVQSVLGVKLKKGHTCQSAAYYTFVLGFAHHLRPNDENGLVEATSAVALESIHVVVESADACRFRSLVTQEGHIRVGVDMSVDSVIAAVHKDFSTARVRRETDRKARTLSDQQARQVQRELGLTRKVYKAGIVRIGHGEFQECLRRIVNLKPENKEHLKMSLSGNALGVAGSGQFCHLGDDGAVIIPHDWADKSAAPTSTATAFPGG